MATTAAPAASGHRIYRHQLPVRIFHWLNALCFVLLLMSGFQIFNAHPRLYFGHEGHVGVPAVFEIGGASDLQNPQGWIKIGSYKINTNVFGEPVYLPDYKMVATVAFPSWATLPSKAHDLGRGRDWHFLMLWIFTFNLAWYGLYGVLSRRFFRTLLPTRDQLEPRAILHELRMHARFKRLPQGTTVRYNLLQKISYIVVLFGLLPAMILTGMTMSAAALAIFPWLIDLFGGRQTARTLHFIFALALLLFVLVHIVQIFVAGFGNEMRSILTGWFHVRNGSTGPMEVQPRER